MVGEPPRNGEFKILFGRGRTHLVHRARHDAMNEQMSFVDITNLFGNQNVEPCALRQDIQNASVGENVHLSLDKRATALRRANACVLFLVSDEPNTIGAARPALRPAPLPL